MFNPVNAYYQSITSKNLAFWLMNQYKLLCWQYKTFVLRMAKKCNHDHFNLNENALLQDDVMHPNRISRQYSASCVHPSAVRVQALLLLLLNYYHYYWGRSIITFSPACWQLTVVYTLMVTYTMIYIHYMCYCFRPHWCLVHSAGTVHIMFG